MSASANSLLTSKKKQRTPKPSRRSKSAPHMDDTDLLEMAEEVANFGSWEWDVTKPRAKWSREMFRIFGLPAQAEGLTLEEYRSFIHPDDLPEITQRMQNAFKHNRINQKSELDYRIIRHDGSTRTIHSQRQIKELTEDGKVKVVVGVDHDVTEQRHTEQVLAENAKRLALAEQVAGFGSWELNLSQTRAVWSPGMFHIFGIEPIMQGLTYDEYASFIHPDDLAAANRNIELMVNAGLNHKESFDYRIIRPDGQTRILHAQRQVVEVGENGVASIVVGVDQDVTEQKQAQEALKRSEERFRIVAEAANVMVYEIDVPNRKLHFVHGSENLLGYKPHDIGETIDWSLATIHPNDLPQVMAKLNATIADPTKDKYSMEYRVRQKKRRLHNRERHRKSHQRPQRQNPTLHRRNARYHPAPT